MIIQADELYIISLAEEIQEQIQREVLLSVSIGISEKAYGYRQFTNAFYQSTDALRHKYYLGDGAIISISDVDESLTKQNIKFRNDFELIIDNIKVGNRKASLEKFDSLLRKLKANLPQDSSFIPNMAAEFIISLQRVLAERNIGLYKIMPDFNLYSILNECNTIPDLKSVLTEFINKVTEFIQSRNRNLNCAAVKRVDEYIRKYYHMDITLNDLSKEVYLNPNYLGRLIKKETGKNFSDILTEVRIEKAKELLKNTQIKTYEISERVGINDSRYFSQLFRKMTGMTPTEYRNTFFKL
ncbi:MAG: helix-turn-helix domain-containing protein [Clostridiaceae bacterium]|nr:helix-turn-helix domain-containing protein [Clostridiaceae bacterium]